MVVRSTCDLPVGASAFTTILDNLLNFGYRDGLYSSNSESGSG